ncbi:Endolytic murein transglycosylase [uncultured Gammaproteobacteria bacterium]
MPAWSSRNSPADRVMRRLAVLLGILLTLGTVLVATAVWTVARIEAPGPLVEARTVVVARGGLFDIADTLVEAGVVNHLGLFLVATMSGGGHALKAGEYLFPAGASIAAVVELLRQGKTVVHRLTVPEGWTSAQVVALIKAEPALSGDLTLTPAEGSLLPGTYHFSLNDGRNALVERLRAAMTVALREAWAARAKEVTLASPEQVLVLASMVEKETGLAAERPRVAGVFLNRLQAGMRLQSDPTVIYALTKGGAPLGRSLTRADLKTESAYNTYYAEGLPPGPIANPGKAALAAVLNPERHELLYFVADGSGGHVFAKTLAEHNHNVAHWREVSQAKTGQ